MAPPSSSGVPSEPGPATPVRPPRRNRGGKLARAAFTVAWLTFILFAALILALRYAILPHIDHYRPQLEVLASRMLHQKVTVAAVSSSWQGLRPRLSLTGVEVYDSEGDVGLSLPEVDATLSWSSLLVVQPRLHSLEFGAPDLVIRRDANDHLFFGGIYVDLSGGHKSGFSDWLLAQQQIIIRHAHLKWRDELREAPDLTLDDIGIVLERFGTRHRFAVTATPDERLAGPIDLRGFFDHGLFVDEGDMTRWSGEMYLALGTVDLAAWHDYLDYPIEIDRGKGDLRAWLHFEPLAVRNGRDTRLPDLTADLRLNDVVARGAPNLPQLALASVDGRITWRETAEADELALHDFSVLGADGIDLPTSTIAARWTLDKQGAVNAGELRADRVDLENLADLMRRVPLSQAVRGPLDALKPKGELTHFSAEWRGPLDNPASYTVSSDVSGLSIASLPGPGGDASANSPGFANLSGRLHATETAGNLILDSRASVLTLPGIFDTPQLNLQRLEGEFDWKIAKDDFELSIAALRFENQDVAGSVQGRYRRGPNSGSSGPGYLDISGHLTRVVGPRVVAYLPVTIGSDVKRYVEHAVLTGSSDDTAFVVRGALERFPFKDRGGVKPAAYTPGAASGPEQFHIDAHLHGVKFDYAPRNELPPGSPPVWPTMLLPDAELIVDQTRMQISAPVAKVYGYTLSNVRALLPDLDDHNQVMQVRGEGSGPFADLLQFVATSPVAGWIGHFTDNAAATGNVRLTLALDMPFSHMDDTHVNGALQLEGNDVSLFTWLPPLARTTGRLDFSENGIGLSDVRGDILGGSLKLSGTTHDDHVIEINGEGTLAAVGFKHLPGWPVLTRIDERLDGTAHYTIAVHVPGRSTDEHAASAREPRVVLESTLAGLAVDLPDPLHKAPADTLPLRVELGAPQGHGRDLNDEIRVRLGSAVSVVVARRADEHGELRVAQVAYGVNEAAVMSDTRSSLNLTAKTFDADAWQRTLTTLVGDADLSSPPAAGATPTAAAPANALAAFVPETANVHVDTLHLWDKAFTSVAVSAQHAGPIWQMTVGSDQVAGRVSWRQGQLTGLLQSRVTARLTRLAVPQSVERDVNTLLQPSTTEIPGLDIVADNVELGAKKFGHLELLASNMQSAGKREWRLEKLNLSNPDATLDAQGSWGAEDGNAASPVRTRLNFTVTASNVGGILERMAIPGTVDKGTATLKGDINWKGSPLSIDYGSLAGNIKLEAARGQFLKADPGVAKLLGVLSLQGLARRLTFDFSDIFGSGFAFDTIDATATVKDGILSTPDFVMKGPSAWVAIKGSVDLSRETQDLHVVLFPRINLSGASLLLLANPATALATVLLSPVLEGPLSNVFRVDYNVSGPWAAPVFAKVESRQQGAPDSSDQPARAPAAPPAPAAAPGNPRSEITHDPAASNPG